MLIGFPRKELLLLLLCLPTPFTLASGGGAIFPFASFTLHLAGSSVTLAGSVYKSRGDNVVCMWMQLKRCSVTGYSGEFV